jgi:phospholipid/cholesterol/gamma-HCH transport system substrate-binding protein
MKQNILETIVGFFIIIITICFFIFTYNSSNIGTNNGYNVTANFQNIDGINVGSNVVISGIKIGSVEKIILDPQNFFAVLTLKLNDDIKIPNDSQANIVTSGLLGNRVIAIVPGMEEEHLRKNEHIKYTQSAVNIETLVGKFMYSLGSKQH